MDKTFVLYKVLSTQQAACIHHDFIQCRNLLNIQINLAPSLFEQNTSKTRFSRVLSIIGISLIQIFVITAIIAYFANPYRNLSDMLK